MEEEERKRGDEKEIHEKGKRELEEKRMWRQGKWRTKGGW